MLITIPDKTEKELNMISDNEGNEMQVTTYVWYKGDMTYSYSFYQQAKPLVTLQ